MNVAFQSVISGVMLVAAVHCSAQERETKLPATQKNRDVRRLSHSYLFAEYIEGKKVSFHEDKKSLKEVVVFSTSTEFESEKELPLPDGSDRAAGMFDHLVLRGENLQSLSNVNLSPMRKGRSMKLVIKTKEEHVFRMPPLPLPSTDGTEIAINLTGTNGQKIIVKEVAFRSSGGLGVNFDEYSKLMDAFPQTNERVLIMQKTFYDDTKNRTCDDLAASMSANSEAFVGIIAMASMTSGFDVLHMRGVLSDRRVSKLHEAMSQLDSSEASKIAVANFDREFASYKVKWMDSTILPATDRYAIHAHLFLCSEFSTTEEFGVRVESMRNWYAALKAKKGFQFTKSGPPDFLFVANLMANRIIKERGMDTREANVWLTSLVSSVTPSESKVPTISEEWLPSSDWTPRRIDLIKRVPVFRSYGSLRGEGIQERTLDRLSAELLP